MLPSSKNHPKTIARPFQDRSKTNRREDTVLRDQINDAVKTAMKSQDKLRLSTLRMVNAGIKNADIEARGTGKGLLADAALLGLLPKLVNQPHASVELSAYVG